MTESFGMVISEDMTELTRETPPFLLAVEMTAEDLALSAEPSFAEAFSETPAFLGAYLTRSA